MSKAYKPIKDWSRRDRKISKKGYVLIYVPEHPKSFGGYYYEHRLVAERELGRVLKSWETTHHINEIRQDNSTKNLFVCTRKEHDHVSKIEA